MWPSSTALTTSVAARSFTSGWPKSIPRESPSTSNRSGADCVGTANGASPSGAVTTVVELGAGIDDADDPGASVALGAGVVVVGVGRSGARWWWTGTPSTWSTPAPEVPVCPMTRSAPPTTWERPSALERSAMGRSTSMATVRRAPSGASWAERMSVGPSRTSHTAKHARPAHKAWRQSTCTRPDDECWGDLRTTLPRTARPVPLAAPPTLP